MPRRSDLALVAAVLLTGSVSAAPPPVVRTVALAPADAVAPTCSGLAFLPNGRQVAVRWQYLPAPAPGGLVELTAESRLSVIGPANEPPATIDLPRVDFPSPPLSRSGIAVTRAGEVLTSEGGKWLLAAAPDGAGLRTRRIEVGPNFSRVAGRVWLGGPGEDVFLLTDLIGVGYSLRTAPGKLLEDGRGESKVVLRGDSGRENLLDAADLHASGKWFAACYGAGGVPRDPRLDFWEVGETAKKRTVKLPVAAMSVLIAPDAKSIALGLSDGRVAYLNAADLTSLRDPTPAGRFTVSCLAYHPRGHLLASGTFDHDGADNLVVVNPLTRDVALKFAADPRGVQAVCFNADGTRMATFGSGKVTIWDTTALKLK